MQATLRPQRRSQAGSATSDPSGSLSAGHAFALGAIQGPAELLPVSSSGHLVLVPWLARWPYSELDPELKKSFEVAVHAGTALALAIVLRHELADELRLLDRRRATVLALSFLPPALAGYTLERPIERHLGQSGTVAGGLIAGAIAMALADRRPQLRGPGEAGSLDGLLLGAAQAAALVPGISRNGATLAAMRMRGFTREQANLLSRTAALPIILGATALKGARLARRGLPRSFAGPMAIGVGASFASTLASHRLIRLVERDRALWPYAAYRAGLSGVALTVIARRRRAARRRQPPAQVVESLR